MIATILVSELQDLALVNPSLAVGLLQGTSRQSLRALINMKQMQARMMMMISYTHPRCRRVLVRPDTPFPCARGLYSSTNVPVF